MKESRAAESPARRLASASECMLRGRHVCLRDRLSVHNNNRDRDVAQKLEPPSIPVVTCVRSFRKLHQFSCMNKVDYMLLPMACKRCSDRTVATRLRTSCVRGSRFPRRRVALFVVVPALPGITLAADTEWSSFTGLSSEYTGLVGKRASLCNIFNLEEAAAVGLTPPFTAAKSV